MGLILCFIYLLAFVSIQPVQQAGSYILLIICSHCILSLSSTNIKWVIRSITSLGVKCSQASSFELSANFLTNSSNIKPISWLSTLFGCKSIWVLLNFLTNLKSKLTFANFSICFFISKFSKISWTFCENESI